MRRLRLAALGLGLLLTAGCRIEDHTPTGTRRDEDRIQHLISRYARSLSARDWSGVRSLFWQDGTYAGPIGPGNTGGFTVGPFGLGGYPPQGPRRILLQRRRLD